MVAGLNDLYGPAAPSNSTGAATHPEEIDEAAPDQTHASIHAGKITAPRHPPPVECDLNHLYFLPEI
jgi:hypothetical protein